MAIIFRTAGPWGAGTGTNLPAHTIDLNFWELLSRIVFLEDNPDRAVSIDYFSVSGNLLTIFLTDHSTRGPFELPVARWNFRGPWAPATDYVVQDVVTFNGSAYLVTWPHHSAATFDPGANDGMGHDFYGLLITDPDSVLPLGGDTGQVLTKRSNADLDTEWTNAPESLPPGGTFRQALRKHSGADFDATWQDVLEHIAELRDVALTSPLEDGELLAWDESLARWTNKPRATRALTLQISEADLIAGTLQRILPPGEGTIVAVAAVAQKTIEHGGALAFDINGIAVTGSTLTFHDGDFAGIQYAATPSANNNFFLGDEIKVTPTGFNGTAAAGAVNVTLAYV